MRLTTVATVKMKLCSLSSASAAASFCVEDSPWNLSTSRSRYRVLSDMQVSAPVLVTELTSDGSISALHTVRCRNGTVWRGQDGQWPTKQAAVMPPEKL